MSSCVLFFVSGVAGMIGARIFFGELEDLIPALGSRAKQKEVRQVSLLLLELEECLASGLVPDQKRWDALAALPKPWGALSYESVRELRASGGSLLPTLKRLRELAENQIRTLSEARSRAAQATAQAVVCAFLIPVMGTVFRELIPGVEERPVLWLAACFVAFVAALVGGLWLLALADAARWAGLKKAQRPWILAAQCAGERFLSILRSGNPADIAWSRACELLTLESPELALAWGHSVWQAPQTRSPSGSSAARALSDAGDGLRKAVQVSLMEGRPCGDRVESALNSLRHEIGTCIERELQLLPARALKPLFACVAPAILGLLAFGLYLCWMAQAS